MKSINQQYIPIAHQTLHLTSNIGASAYNPNSITSSIIQPERRPSANVFRHTFHPVCVADATIDRVSAEEERHSLISVHIHHTHISHTLTHRSGLSWVTLQPGPWHPVPQTILIWLRTSIQVQVLGIVTGDDSR